MRQPGYQHRKSLRWIARAFVLAGALMASPAHAGLFDTLLSIFTLGAYKSAPVAASTPAPSWVPQEAAVPRAPSGRSSAGYCVRLCDGKYFPLQARGRMSTAGLCDSFCPASRTQVFYGRSIDTATSADGERYASIENAFHYRDAFKSNCTCNGRSPVGLASIDLLTDATLRRGDIISTNNGLLAFTGSTKTHEDMKFTPLETYAGRGSKSLRWALRDVKVTPVVANLAAPTVRIMDHSDDLIARSRALSRAVPIENRAGYESRDSAPPAQFIVSYSAGDNKADHIR